MSRQNFLSDVHVLLLAQSAELKMQLILRYISLVQDCGYAFIDVAMASHDSFSNND